MSQGNEMAAEDGGGLPEWAGWGALATALAATWAALKWAFRFRESSTRWMVRELRDQLKEATARIDALNEKFVKVSIESADCHARYEALLARVEEMERGRP